MPCVLGINMSHTGAACLMDDGKVLAAVAEERLSRLKGDAGFPRRAIASVLDTAGVDARDVDAIAVGTLAEHFLPRLAQDSEYRPGIRLVGAASRWLPLSVLGSSVVRDAYRWSAGGRRRREWGRQHYPVLLDMGFGASVPVHRFEHHACHAAAAWWLRPFAGDGVVLTCDGLGDGLAATVSVGRGDDLCRVAEISSVHSIGSLYSRVTRFLGMKPWEHEGKVMGLAPYADPERARAIADEFLKFVQVKGLRFENRLGLIGNGFLDHLQRRYGLCRFDDIAYAVQTMTEIRLAEWAGNVVDAQGSRRVCAGGGVFMNVKANARIEERVDELFVFPAPGDESIAVGAALLAENDIAGEVRSVPMDAPYWGPDVSPGVARAVGALDRDLYDVSEHGDGIDRVVAGLLAEGEIVGRVEGRMEFGPRALGHRSLLADPSRLEAVGELNAAVKNRDFWMPFAPAILEEEAADYLDWPSPVRSPHMTLAVPTRPQRRGEIAAALHPADHTARPQIVRDEDAPRFAGLLREFRRLRGIGAVLNTSLNLHGSPIVASAEDAIGVLQESGLRFLALDGHLVRKRGGRGSKNPQTMSRERVTS